MINAQEWLDKNYPRNQRNKINKLEIVNGQLEGNLKIENFSNLEVILIALNKLDNLNIEKMPKLRVLVCNDNQIKSLKITNCPEIVVLQCGGNFLTEIDLSQLSVDKLQEIDLSTNNLSSRDLTFFKRFKNLRSLKMQGTDGTKGKEIYNHFHGSLESIKDLNKLQFLNISDTDISSGLDHLPNSVTDIICDNKARPEASCKEIKLRLEMCKDCKVVAQSAPVFGPWETYYQYQIWKKWKKGDEGNYDRLKELAKIVLPNSTFDFEKLKFEISKLKLADLNCHLEFKNTKLKELTNSLKNKLDEDAQEWLETLFEAQSELTKINSSFAVKQIEKAKKMIIRKSSENELQEILIKQKEITELENQLKDLQIQETNIQIPPKK